MSLHTNPFETLGLPARRDLTNAQVDAAWRKIAVATHPDRQDGGDLARYTRACASFAELRTPWSRSEAYADLEEQARAAGYDGLDDDGHPHADPLSAGRFNPETGLPLGDPAAVLARLPARIRRGRPRRLLLRAAITLALSLAAVILIPGRLPAPATLVTMLGLAGWFVLDARHDLAPPPDR